MYASFWALLLLSAVAIASPALAQSAPQRPEPQPAGSARINGRVLAADNGAPVRRAPRCLLLDEPEGGLDDASLARWRSVLTDLVTGGEVVVILAAHGATALDNVPITELRPTPP